MAKKVQQITSGLGAAIVGQVAHTGGAFGARTE
jgi:hypothetical protein